MEQRVQPFVGRVVEERAGLLGGPHHHRRRALGGVKPLDLLPQLGDEALVPCLVRKHQLFDRVSPPGPVGSPRRDPLVCPHQSLRALPALQLHERRRVHQDELLSHRVVQRLTQRRPNALLRRRPNGFTPLQLRALLIGPGRANRDDACRLGIDRVEHRRHVADAQLVQRQLAEVGQEVQADVCLVRPRRAALQLPPSSHPLGEPLADGHRPAERLPGLLAAAELVVIRQGQAPLQCVVDESEDLLACRRANQTGFGDGQEQTDRALCGLGGVAAVEPAALHHLALNPHPRWQLQPEVPGAVLRVPCPVRAPEPRTRRARLSAVVAAALAPLVDAALHRLASSSTGSTCRSTSFSSGGVRP
nr:hypothetical protein [Umezawaea tangerina]